MRLSSMFAAAVLAVSVLCSAAVDAKELWLISKDEAAKPAGPPKVRMAKRGAPTGPKISIVSPKLDDVLHSPLAVSVHFEPRENVPVDLASLKVVVQKLIDIDITDRVMPYATADGISIDEAKVPSGEHLVEISVADAQGRRTSEILKLSVTKP